jgi:hypothetical protein
MRRAWILSAMLPLVLRGQPDADALLGQTRARIVENLAKLPKYTCVQTIERSRFEMFYASRVKNCGDPPAKKGTAQNRPTLLLAWTDRFKLDVTVSDGAEIFSWAGAREFQSSDAQEIVGGGVTGSGDFGPFLMDIFGGAAPETQSVGMEQIQGRTLARYQYRVPAAASHYQIKVGVRPADMATLAYEGEFWIDPRTAELRRLTIVVPNPPPHAETCRIETEIDYRPVAIAGAPLLLPQATALKLWDADGSRYENRIGYAACRAFQSESVFRPELDGSAADLPAAATAAKAAPVIPAGLTLRIALRSPIDMESVFGGEAIDGQLAEAMQAPGGAILAPQGAIVHGRVVRAERHFQPARFFALGLRFHSVSIDGVEVPLALDPAPHSAEEQTLIGASEKRQGIGMFMFRGDPRVLDDWFVTEWKTTARKASE